MTSQSIPRFENLYFGAADAQTEYGRNPEAFLRSYADMNSCIEKVKDDRIFLVLGPKGTGKTALACFLSDPQKRRDDLNLVKIHDASTLPISEVSKLKTGDEKGIARSIVAWKFILLCSIVEVILEDQGSLLNSDPHAYDLLNELKERGFLTPDSAQAILTATKTTHKFTLKFWERSSEKTKRVHINAVVSQLEQWVRREHGPATHISFMDGLDSLYLNDSKYIESLSSLVTAAWQINKGLMEERSSSRIVLLLRSDIYTRLSLPDGGKMRADWAVDLDWRILSGNISDSPLFDLVNRKAVSKIAVNELSVIDQYFPGHVEFGPRRPTDHYLMELTRQTPRDILQLFDAIKEAGIQNGILRHRNKVDEKTIRQGVVKYANNYFVDSVRNELVGYEEDSGGGSRAVDALRKIGRRYFNRDDYIKAMSADSIEDIDVVVDRNLRRLFSCGVIANVVAGKDDYIQFGYRRDDSECDLDTSFVLHSALLHAWNIPWNAR